MEDAEPVYRRICSKEPTEQDVQRNPLEKAVQDVVNESSEAEEGNRAPTQESVERPNIQPKPNRREQTLSPRNNQVRTGVA